MTLGCGGSGEERWALAGPEWFDDLRRYWDDQRAGADLPDADELFLADLCEIMPSLLLAYLDPLRGSYRIEYAGAITRALLGGDLLGLYPEWAEPGTTLSWIGAGYAGSGRLIPPGIVQIRHQDLMATHLPYRNATGKVGLILTALAKRPAPLADGRGATVLPFPGNRGSDKKG
ncbi:hypothetical protein [Thalassobaculum salexigens]|uniref:hypothetical protein n=1 Tax=Thalassobaculum salexigens TaxID=455360 RepID=UPI00041FFD9A|nr:hypothetical protein [Thalassobaculum salexigens]